MIPTDHVSEHFSKKEMCCSHCGKCELNSNLIIGLEQLRALGPEPIIVHDAYRCEEHNKDVGGVPHSEHPKGEAADIEIKGLTLQQMFDRAESIPVFRDGGIGVYDGAPFIHLDVRTTRARWGRVKGKYVAASELVNTSVKEA
jgi:uncharacterized protein YcbK (DUF882 family)